MNKFLFSLLAGLALIGCVAPVEESENEIDPAGSVNSDDTYQYQNKNKGPNNCVPQFQELKTPDGETVIIQVPMLCDKTVYLFKGDPPPDAVKHGEEAVNPDLSNEMINNSKNTLSSK